MRKNCDPQTFGIGLKEIWEIPKELHEPGKIIHTVGWPADYINSNTWAGSFLYFMEPNLLLIGK